MPLVPTGTGWPSGVTISATPRASIIGRRRRPPSSFTAWAPARTRAALAHLEAGVAQAKEMWKFILAETDDDNEWIPNPKQTGVVGVKVTQEMIDAWRETLDEAEQVLQGRLGGGLVLLEVDVAVGVHAGAGGDEAADDDVLLEAAQVVDAAGDGRFGEDARGLLERGR